METPTEDSSKGIRSGKSKSLLATAIVLILAVSVVGVFTFQLSQQLETLTDKVDNLAVEVENVQVTISADTSSELVDDLEALTSSVESLKIGVDELSSRPQSVAGSVSDSTINRVYNDVRDSIVLITVSTMLGGGSGSGFVYDELGHILTNNHVIQDSDEITVIFEDGNAIRASVVGTDPFSDLAVLRLQQLPTNLQPVKLGDSSELKIGEQVIAIGSPFGLSGTVTAGIVSQKGRLLPGQTGYPIPNVVQIDAAVNPGNSGGPLLNTRGEVVGITTAGVGVNLNFAIPSNTVNREVPILIAEGSYGHPFIGIATISIDPEVASIMNLDSTKGLLILDVARGGPADQAGVSGGSSTAIINGVELPIGGDVIVAADAVPISKFEDLVSYIDENLRPGDTVVLKVIRDNVEIEIPVILAERPL